jgi:hypothetical protein
LPAWRLGTKIFIEIILLVIPLGFQIGKKMPLAKTQSEPSFQKEKLSLCQLGVLARKSLLKSFYWSFHWVSKLGRRCLSQRRKVSQVSRKKNFLFAGLASWHENLY